MAGLVTGDIVSVTYWGTLFSQRVMNVLKYRIGADSTDPTYQGAAAKLAFAMYSGPTSPGLAMLSAQGPEYKLDEVRVQKINGGRERYVSSFADLPGTYAGNCTSPNVSAVLIKKSAAITRRGLGTFHLPGIPEQGYTGGYLTPAYQVKINQIGARLINVVTPILETMVAQPVIWTPADAQIYFPIISTTLITTLRIMRRRTVGLGI